MAGVVGAGALLRRRWGLAVSVCCGVTGLFALGVVAVSALSVINLTLGVLGALRGTPIVLPDGG
jgi:hypothetical protein